MNIDMADSLAADMTNRLLHADDFFTTLSEFDSQKKFREEYLFALKSAIVRRLPFEQTEWRKLAISYLDEV